MQEVDYNYDTGGGERWGIVGIALMPWDKPMTDILKKQDCLYTVKDATTAWATGDRASVD